MQQLWFRPFHGKPSARFDLPAHGMHPAHAAQVLEFARVLVNIQATLGQP
ncbi:hypothetical protein [Natronospirillum operosum]|nr:hypothetical protein [Natronospirillum operosum]